MPANNPRDSRGSPLQRTTKAFQENVTRSGGVAAASYALIGSILMLGGIGYAIDRWQGTAPWFLAGGLFLGVAVGMYELAKTVWHK
jgi:F0F1-type ATP synthase assembly protein I